MKTPTWMVSVHLNAHPGAGVVAVAYVVHSTEYTSIYFKHVKIYSLFSTLLDSHHLLKTPMVIHLNQ